MSDVGLGINNINNQWKNALEAITEAVNEKAGTEHIKLGKVYCSKDNECETISSRSSAEKFSTSQQ